MANADTTESPSPTTAMETVILRTGVEAPKVLVATMYLVCESMMDENPIAVFEAVSLARDPSHQLFGNSGNVLRDAAMLDCSGKMHRSVREILCAFFEGEMMDMKLLGPGRYLKQ